MEETTPEVMDGSALMSIEKATIDMQIATAHAYPRSMELFQERAIAMVTLDEETAASCIYRRPVGKEEVDGKWVEKHAEGKSIRLAEIVGASYGNLRVAAMLLEQTPRYVKARGMGHDLESNFASSCEVIESTVTSKGKPYSERMRAVVAKVCLAKARRDVTFQVVPGALCKGIESAARKKAIGTTATLGSRREKVVAWVNLLGIDSKRVWAALSIKGPDDIGLEELEALTGLKTAIKDGDISAAEAFPPIDGQKSTSSLTLGKEKNVVWSFGTADPEARAEQEKVDQIQLKLKDAGLEVEDFIKVFGEMANIKNRDLVKIRAYIQDA